MGAAGDGPMRSVAVEIDFGIAADPPLVKKFGQFNSGIAPLAHYERDAGRLAPIAARTLRFDVGMGASPEHAFVGQAVVTGAVGALRYDFGPLERIARLALAAGAQPCPCWCYVPTPLQAGGDFRRLDTSLPGWDAAWEEICRRAAARFRELGIRVGYHEIYNEPDLPEAFFLAPFERYLALYRRGAAGIAAGDPDAPVAGPSLADAANRSRVSAFLEDVAARDLPLDVFTFHHYWQHGRFPEKLAAVRAALAADARFATTEIHLNEVNWVAGWQGSDSIHNTAGVAPGILDIIRELLEATDITMCNWAQFMESTAADDAYGIVHRDGRVKAAYNVFRAYADMPEERVRADGGDRRVGVMASSDGRRHAAILWNRTDDTVIPVVTLRGIAMPGLVLRTYRIDAAHASALDGAPEELAASREEATPAVVDGRMEWTAPIPARGVVYLVLEPSDATPLAVAGPVAAPARDVRLHYAFERRGDGSYAFFDRARWRAFLGAGPSSGSRALTGITLDDVPRSLAVSLRRRGGVGIGSDRSTLAVRLDYRTGGGFVRSVAFHDGVWGPRAQRAFPLGTRRAPDGVVVLPTLARFAVRAADHAPPGWDGRVILSVELCDTGAATAATLSLGGALPDNGFDA